MGFVGVTVVADLCSLAALCENKNSLQKARFDPLLN